TRVRVDLDLAHVGAEWPDEVRRLEVGDGLEPLLHAGGQLTVRGKGHFAHSLRLVRRALDRELAVVELDVLFRRLEDVRGHLLAFVDDLRASLGDGNSADGQSARTVRPVAKAWTLVGVAVPYVDLLDGHPQGVGRDLGVGRVVALAVVVSADVDTHTTSR